MNLLEGSQVSILLKLETRVRQDGDQWIAWCVPLDILTQADSAEEAQKALREAIDLWFESCLDRGVLEEALLEAGFHRANKAATPASGRPDRTAGRQGKRTPAVEAPAQFIEVSIPAYLAASNLGAYAPR